MSDNDQSNESKSDEIIQGEVIEVEVATIADFGVFVKCSTGEEGLIHISEVANEYVTNINKYVKVGEKVNVKVLGRNKKGKLEFSIKKVVDKPAPKALFLKSLSENKEFEDLLTKYLKKSEEKHIDIRRNLKKKHGITKKKN
tara:strand:+ start:184 stop:609 length:426 start_codon:yes stop_codon:yes gene_type:complete